MKKSSSRVAKRPDPMHKYREKRDAATVAKENKQLLKRLDEAEAQAGIAEALRIGAKAPKPIKARRLSAGHKRVATPVFLCSDWHVEEVVKPETVAGVNEYNLDIAAARIDRLGDAMAWMIDHHRKSFEIREAVLWLGGDLLSGYIHDELKETNALSPVQTLLFLQEHISRMLSKLLSISGMESLVIPCSYGNHGRSTHKMMVARGAANSYEWLMYHQLRRTWADNNKVQFYISDGDFLRLKVHQTNLGFHHGHAAKFGGGVGGVTVPLFKATAKWNTYGECDVWNVGHFHQLYDLPRLVVNGSLIGTSPYGMSVGGFEAPAQASYLIDAKRGKCMSTTLWVEGAKEKGR